MPDRVDYEALAATLDGFLREQLFLNYKGELMRCAIAVRALGRERDAAEHQVDGAEYLCEQYVCDRAAALRRAEEAEAIVRNLAEERVQLSSLRCSARALLAKLGPAEEVERG